MWRRCDLAALHATTRLRPSDAAASDGFSTDDAEFPPSGSRSKLTRSLHRVGRPRRVAATLVGVPDYSYALPQSRAGRYLPRSGILSLLTIVFRSCFGGHAVDPPRTDYAALRPLFEEYFAAAFSGRPLSARSSPLRRDTREASLPAHAPLCPLLRHATRPLDLPLPLPFAFPILPRHQGARAFSRHSQCSHAPPPHAPLCAVCCGS